MTDINDAVRTNYNPTGISVIETLYDSPGHLSPGGKAATRALASRIRFKPDDHVLDVGSGVGGPAQYLAGQYGCQVTGLELVETSVDTATHRIQSAGLQDKVHFECGNATAMPFDDNTFSIVWSQDAWCHIDDRQRLLEECARVIKPDGTLIFSDWLLTGNKADTGLDDILDALSSPSLATLEHYTELVQTAGFTNIEPVDDSQRFAEIYADAMRRIEQQKTLICSKFSERVYDIVMEKNQILADGFSSGLIGGGSISARRRSTS